MPAAPRGRTLMRPQWPSAMGDATEVKASLANQLFDQTRAAHVRPRLPVGMASNLALQLAGHPPGCLAASGPPGRVAYRTGGAAERPQSSALHSTWCACERAGARQGRGERARTRKPGRHASSPHFCFERASGHVTSAHEL
jgi:hypothetical protein